MKEVKIKDVKFELEDRDAALIIAIQNLTEILNALRSKL